MRMFEKLEIEPVVIRALSDMGFEEPTPIQEKTIPLAVAGRDLIGRAQTGTGKTAAYGIPMTIQCCSDSAVIQGVVITPTRELAIQVAEELNRIGKFKYVRALPIYGGQEIDRQIRALKKRPQIIVGTPGRLMDHMRRRTIRLDAVRMLVLDEADEMLNMGFKEDIEAIIEQMPGDQQNLLFSATMPVHIQQLARQFMKEPEVIHIAPREVTVSNIEQQFMEMPEKQKLEVLCRLLDIQNPPLAIVFVRTKRRVDEITAALKERGYSAEGIHGDLTQNMRDTVMRKFRSGEAEILIATDVAARGLDISGVTHIYNFDIPQDPEGYVHRIGRTGRAGEAGLAITFVTPREFAHLKLIEQIIKQRMNRVPVPTMSDALAGLQQVVADDLLKVVETQNIQQFKNLAQNLLDQHDSVTLLSAALRMLTREPEKIPFQELSDAPPIRVKRTKNEYAGHSRKERRDKNSSRGFSKHGKPWIRTTK